MNMPGIGELIVIFMIVLLVFGAGKIPAIAKDMGSGIRDFKKAMNGEFDERENKK
jgi:sec-independent protein translocase protein TatA